METSIVDTFLQGLLSPPGAGALLWLIVAAILKAAPDLSSNVKFWFTFVMAFAIPPLAYWLRILLGYDVFTWEGLLLMIGVGYLVSQGVHRGTEQAEKKLARLG